MEYILGVETWRITQVLAVHSSRAPIEVIDLERFANGKPVWVMQESCEYSSDEIVSRARSRVGESQYRIFSNNCEHFCSWCISGKSCSAQVRAFLHCPRYLFSFVFSVGTVFYCMIFLGLSRGSYNHARARADAQ